MNNILLMNVLESVTDLVSDMANHVGVKLAFLNSFEVTASHNFLHDTEVLVVFKDIEYSDDARVVSVIENVQFRLEG